MDRDKVFQPEEMYERIGASPAAVSPCDCCARIVAGTSARRPQKRSGRNHSFEGKSGASNDGDFHPGCIPWVRINGRKSFSNKSLHENSLPGFLRLLASRPSASSDYP